MRISMVILKNISAFEFVFYFFFFFFLNFFFLSSVLTDFQWAFPLIQQTSSEEASVRVCVRGPQEADKSQVGQAVTENAKEACTEES